MAGYLFVGTLAAPRVVSITTESFTRANLRQLIADERNAPKGPIARARRRRVILSTPPRTARTQTTLELPQDLGVSAPVGSQVQVRFDAMDSDAGLEGWVGERTGGSLCVMRRGIQSMVVPCSGEFPLPGVAYSMRVDPVVAETTRERFKFPPGAVEAGEEFRPPDFPPET